MAKKKAKKPTTRRRRRSVGAVNKDLMIQAAGALGGYVVGTMLSAKIAPTMDKKIKGAAIAAVGVLLVPMVLKNSVGRGLAIGLATSGGVQLLQGLGVISGRSELQMLPSMQNGRMLAGPGINAMVNGPGISQMVNGPSRRMGAMNNALKYG